MSTDQPTARPPLLVDVSGAGDEPAETALPPEAGPFPLASDPEADIASDQEEVAEAQRMKREARGQVTDTAGLAPIKWTSPIEAFLAEEAQVLPTTTIQLRRPNGWGIDLEVTTLSTPRYNKVIATHTKWVRDPRTGERLQDTDDRMVKCALVIEGCKQIDFNDARLLQAYNATDPYDLVERMFLRFEIDRICGAVARLSGMAIDDEETETAGNF